MTDILIFVEGKNDKHFVSSMIELWFSNLKAFKIETLGGNQLKPEYKILIKDQVEAGCKDILIILDADDCFQRTQERIDTFQKDLSTSIRDLSTSIRVKPYIFPNNEDNGNLETLLERMVKPEHQSILECFKRYEDCLKEQQNKNYKTPNQKAKIYAYLEAQGEACKEEKRNYKDENIWNLEQDDLIKFREFLKQTVF